MEDRKIEKVGMTLIAMGRDLRRPTWAKEGPAGALAARLSPMEPPGERAWRAWVLQASSAALAHRFDLAGSPELAVDSSSPPPGYEGRVRYDVADSKRGLESVNRSNRPEAARIAALGRAGYRSIDWQRDHKSGFRWRGSRWSKALRGGQHHGVDIRVPRGLGRLLHLPSLALAHLLARRGGEGFAAPEEYWAEFRDQVLDFVAHNPPRFGVNWVSAADVSVRLCNMLLAHDLFVSAGADPDAPFAEVFKRSIVEHASHVRHNLDYSETSNGGAYLAELVGLLFAGAYLPLGPFSTDLLCFALQELEVEMLRQFHNDGSGFEASTHAHGFSTELVLFGAAVAVGLPADRRTAAAQRLVTNGWKKVLREIHGQPRFDVMSKPVLSPAFWERLEAAVQFSRDITTPAGEAVTVGDNDGSRLFRVDPAVDLQEDHAGTRLVERPLDLGHLSRAAAGLFSGQTSSFEAALAASLAGGGAERTLPGWAPGPFRPYRGMGIFIYRGDEWYVSVRCGEIGRRGQGGHGHNDALSLTVTVKRETFLVDPGTYVYAADPDARNRFRSTASHCTVAVEGKEQNRWRGLHGLHDDARAEIVEIAPGFFRGRHRGFGPAHARTVVFRDDGLEVEDTCEAPNATIVWVLHPSIEVGLSSGDRTAILRGRGTVVLNLTVGALLVDEWEYSGEYGKKERCLRLRARMESPKVSWSLSWK